MKPVKSSINFDHSNKMLEILDQKLEKMY